MDDVDRRLMTLISMSPRMHYRELAERLGISRQAVHHRIRVLMETGVIQGTTADISGPYLDAVPVVVFGRAKSGPIENTLDLLGESEFTRRVVVAGGNFLYVVGLLRNISELDSFAEFVRHTAEMQEPTVGVYSLNPGLMPEYIVDGIGRRKQSYKRLSLLDLRIIASLKGNARRSVAEIASMVGVSPKTVRRHLEGMISEGSLELSVRSDQPSGGDMLFLLHLTIRDGADKVGLARRLLLRYPFMDAYIRAFSNIPDFLVWIFWTGRLTEMRRVLKETGEERDVLSVVPNFAYLERIYSTTWRDRLPALEVHMPEGRRARRPTRRAKQKGPNWRGDLPAH